MSMNKFLKGETRLVVDVNTDYSGSNYLYENDISSHIARCNKKLKETRSEYYKVLIFYKSTNEKIDNAPNIHKNQTLTMQNNLINPSNMLNPQMSMGISNSKVHQSKYIDIQYYVKYNSNDINIDEIKQDIVECLVDFSELNNVNINIKIEKNNLAKIIAGEVYDFVYNKKEDIKYIFDETIENNDISTLQNYSAKDLITKVEIEDKIYTYDEFIKKFSNELKFSSLDEEIKRIFEVGEANSLQGVNYIIKEKNNEERKNIYNILAKALYSAGRLKYPAYNICNIDFNDEKSNADYLYLKNRFKFSLGEMYFCEINIGLNKNKTRKHGFIFDDDEMFDMAIADRTEKFLAEIEKNQFDMIYAIHFGKTIYHIESFGGYKSACDKLQVVVFEDELNLEAQIEYVKKKLEKTNHADLIEPMIDIVKYQNTIKTGLTTTTLDKYILDLKKSKSEEVYANVYKDATIDMMNGNAFDELKSLVGLENFKNKINELINRKNLNNLKNNCIPMTRKLNKFLDYDRLNFIFYGAPGTGKSMSAYILARILFQYKLIERNKIVKYSHSKNVYEDSFEICRNASLKELFEVARGGVLLIDEAGHLNENEIAELLEMTEEHKNDVAIILCGYESEIMNLLNSNDGIRSRFPNIIQFANYTAEELALIFTEKANKKNFIIDDKAVPKLLSLIREICSVKNSGSVRTIENLLEKVIAIHSNDKINELNIRASKSENSQTQFETEELYKIIKKDFDKVKLEELLGNSYLRYKKYGKPKEEMEKLIGIKEIKTTISKYVAKAKINMIKKQQGLIDGTGFNMHLCFTGNPGTAKTTVARLVARLLCEHGVLETAKVVECGASDLVAEYVGQTAPKVVAKFEEAMGGILFLDEAYSLANSNAGGFNKECIDTIIKEMENHRDNVIVIFAGYKEPMQEFISSNPGFKSRISYFVDFPSYTEDELIQIFDKLITDEGYSLSDKEIIQNNIRKYLSAKMKEKDFGNGRECRLILEKAIDNQSQRLLTLNKKKYTKKELMTLEPEDFNIENMDFYEQDLKIGFAI